MSTHDSRQELASALGLVLWQRRDAPRASASARRADLPSAAASQIDHMGWTELRACVADCTRCALSATRTQTVFGVGSTSAKWLIVGEAPGAEEDRRGEPFVGRAGRLLDGMLRSLGMLRESVYIANVLKCRPPGNRDPAPQEMQQCIGYLERQIALLEPKIILAVGRISAQRMTGQTLPVARLRQREFQYGASQVPLVVTYHPAYLLRTPGDKRKAWDDLKFARSVFERVGQA